MLKKCEKLGDFRLKNVKNWVILCKKCKNLGNFGPKMQKIG